MRGCTRPSLSSTTLRAHVIASSLGHQSFSTTVESYAKPEAIAGARQRRVLTVLDRGIFASSP
jgi:hypothetical protein